MKQLILVFAGGGLGSVARYGLNRLFASYSFNFPMATLTANILSCLIAGITIGLIAGKSQSGDEKLLLITGFCGGFSTFSAFAIETNNLLSANQYAIAFGNIILNLALTITAVFLGSWIAKTAF